MSFTIPEDLAPEVHPLAWLLGTWRGPGFLAYPEISERPFVQEVAFGHDGGPYLTYTSTIWLLDEDAMPGEHDAARKDNVMPGEDDAAHGETGSASDTAGDSGDAPSSTEVTYTAGPVWAVESGYWRTAVAPGSAAPANAADGTAAATGESATDLEVLLAEPSGHVSVYLGTVAGPRVEIATDLLARTATAVEISAVHRMYGLVGGELMWAMDMAAFGHEMRPYASARLARVAADQG